MMGMMGMLGILGIFCFLRILKILKREIIEREQFYFLWALHGFPNLRMGFQNFAWALHGIFLLRMGFFEKNVV